MNTNVTVSIEYPEELPGFGKIIILADDQTSSAEYGIYFSVDSAYTNAKLDSILLLDEPLDHFNPDQADYDVVVPEGTSKYFALSAYAEVNDATVEIVKPSTLPGVASILVTAPDGITEKKYALNISFPTGLAPLQTDKWPFRIIPMNDQRVMLEVQATTPSSLHGRIYDISGRIRTEIATKEIQPGLNHFILEPVFGTGIYIIQVWADGWFFSDKLMLF